ncbi:hypothetical protein A6A06_35990 [Streptomyces sp. CB02923]|uniref:hypothetical protein n=1 Tax=Streptomyces sp. CB02923 TaxID=1718985 RepID=UPI00095B6847|nr:hypothetical protein [Streptomyces sp. CB02923]OKI07317.1 hypothetical protein A6A06_35990 [Streptomyces sp. CB02923]
MIRHVRKKLLSTGAIGIAALVTGLTAMSAGSAVAAPAAGEDDDFPYAVETFDYPNAAKILKEQGIALRKGDGHILLTDCLDPDKDIQVSTSFQHPGQTLPGRYCFKVTGTGKSGYLSLEVPAVYSVMTGDVSVRASLTADGRTESVDVGKNVTKGLGTGATPPGTPPYLVELRVTG